ncbi:MAG: polyprenyl synthetase family protein, partial [Acidimicrobiia bacterium]|nr:polyprenyl synthetase family protein [Acidimicrobiia bacterium]
MDAPELTDLIPIPQVWERLDRVEKRLIEASQADDAFLTAIAQHGLLAGGKRFRPLLAQLTAEFGPNLDHRAIDAGAAVELIHLGSLYHDDVIDEATTRRGAESVNSNWTNTIAILAGDFLMARASEVAASTLGQEAVRLLARTYAELVEGQTLELQVDHDLNHGPSVYYRIIGGKTASLMRTSARLGAMATDAPPGVIEAVSTWAWELGMVFQITDDALDLVATDGYLGKPAGSDIGEGKYTLPVLLALTGPDRSRISELLNNRPYPPEAVGDARPVRSR